MWAWSQTPFGLRTACLCDLSCSNQRRDFFENKVFYFRPVTQDLDVVERPSLRGLVENLFLFKVRNFDGEILNGFGFVRI